MSGKPADSEVFGTWLARMLALEQDARRVELENLPETSLALLTADGAVNDRQGKLDVLADRAGQCAAALATAERTDSRAMQRLVEVASVPDDYATWRRIAGLYALVAAPFAQGVARWQEETQRRFAAQPPVAQAAERIAYVPANVRPADHEIEALFGAMRRDALGVPMLNAMQRQLLLDAYAPRYEIATGGEHDRFGAMFRGSGSVPQIDVKRPLVYRRMAYTRFEGRVLVQLVYSIWFAERPADGLFDLLSGPLDGVMVRVTLDAAGRPLLVDSIHNCGCYHLFMPADGLKLRPAPEPGIEWAFVPQNLPDLATAQPMTVLIDSRTHYVAGLRAQRKQTVPQTSASIPYGAVDDGELRRLELPNGSRRSAFGMDGIIAGTARGERFLFWPMGIDSAGAMRQWGRHATAFLGRRHFDDADLVERRFVWHGAHGAVGRPGMESTP